MLSGVIVKYEKLNPTISSPNKIPFYGQIMTARWGYEALAVNQFMENDYMKLFYPLNRVMSIAEFKKYYWVKNLENKLDYIEKYAVDKDQTGKIKSYLRLLHNEIGKEMAANNTIEFGYLDQLYPDKINDEVLRETREYVHRINKFYIKVYNRASDKRDEIIRAYQKSPEEKEKFIQLKRDYYNDRLAEFVENSNETVRIIEYQGHLIQKIDPIYLDPESNNPFGAHFYSPSKKVFGTYYKTFYVNIIVIWGMSLLLYFVLYFRLLKRLLDLTENFTQRFRDENED